MPFLASSLHYNEGRLKAYPNYLWVFGDNLKRVGKGGQAIIRDEPNAIGLVTKRSPGYDFFQSGNAQDMQAMIQDMLLIEHLHQMVRKIILPADRNGDSTLGTGLSELPKRAPELYAFLNAWHHRMLKL
jgi:hypothetical protein